MSVKRKQKIKMLSQRTWHGHINTLSFISLSSSCFTFTFPSHLFLLHCLLGQTDFLLMSEQITFWGVDFTKLCSPCKMTVAHSFWQKKQHSISPKIGQYWNTCTICQKVGQKCWWNWPLLFEFLCLFVLSMFGNIRLRYFYST